MRLGHPQISGKYFIIIDLAILRRIMIPHGSPARKNPGLQCHYFSSKHKNILIHFPEYRFLNL